MESFTLYPDNTFKWTNEFDLSWDEYGLYKIENNKLTLDYYILFDFPSTMSLKDNISTVPEAEKSIILEMEEDKLYYVGENGKRLPTMLKFPFCKRKWGWLIGNKFEYIIYRED
ncbi:MAG: hypothetical protein WDA08_07750 [Weeksellaceae bacterium]